MNVKLTQKELEYANQLFDLTEPTFSFTEEGVWDLEKGIKTESDEFMSFTEFQYWVIEELVLFKGWELVRG